MSKRVLDEIEVFKRHLLEQRLARCTPKQRAVFEERVYPKGVREDQLIDAIDLCDRTLKGTLDSKP